MARRQRTDRRKASRECPQLSYEGDDLDEQIVMVRAALRRPVVRTLLSKDSYPESQRVETERPFVVRDGSRMVSGRLDRIVWLRDKDGMPAAQVIDYKTDAISMAELSERVEYYRPQRPDQPVFPRQ